MNSEELVREIMKDYSIVVRKAEYTLSSLRRPALKSRNKHVQKIYDYQSINNNNWIILCDYYVKAPSFVVAIHFKDNWGFQAYMVQSDQRSLIHYSGHFLERFHERFLHEPELSKLELLKRYLAINATASLELLPNTEKYRNPFFGRSREGIGLGFIERLERNTLYHFKTFLANDMIFESQQESFNYSGANYKQYWDETYMKRNEDAFDE